jgi:ankyrin repeat protein
MRSNKRKRTKKPLVDPPANETELAQMFINAVVQNPAKAERMLSESPKLKDLRVLHGETILHFFAVEGVSQAVRFLGERGFDVNAKNGFGDSVLEEVCTLGNKEVAEVLLDLGAEVNADSPMRDNPLHRAVQSGNERLVELLLRAGANPQYTTACGETISDALPSSEKRLRLEKILQQFGIRTEPKE